MKTIDEKFNELMEKITEKQFWAYVQTWLNTDFVLDIMKNWDEETKEMAIKEMEEIIKNDRHKNR